MTFHLRVFFLNDLPDLPKEVKRQIDSKLLILMILQETKHRPAPYLSTIRSWLTYDILINLL